MNLDKGIRDRQCTTWARPQVHANLSASGTARGRMRDTVQGGGKREKRSRGKRARAGNPFIPDSLYALHLEKRIDGDARKSGARLSPLDGRVELSDVCEMTRINRLFYIPFSPFQNESGQAENPARFPLYLCFRYECKGKRKRFKTYIEKGKRQ